MKPNSRSRAAGGQAWHRMRPTVEGIRVVGAPVCSFIKKERVPPENLQEKQRIKEQVREQVANYDGKITVIPEGKKAKRSKGARK